MIPAFNASALTPGGTLRLVSEIEDAHLARVDVPTHGRILEIQDIVVRDQILRALHAHESPARIRRILGAKWRRSSRARMLVVRARNGMVNTGIDNIMNRWSGLSLVGSNAVPGFIGVENNTTAVTATTAFLHGAGAGSAATTIIKAFSPVIAYVRPTLTAGASFANADFTSGVFVINKIGWLSTATDAGTGLIDVIGGTGGTDPYSRTFVVDFTAAGTFTLTPQILFTAITNKTAFPSPL